MTLTRQNIETNDRAFHPSAMFRDIARMNDGQLDDYIRRAFTGQRDSSLPRQFFGQYFDLRSHGSSPDGRVAPSPGAFFAGLHDLVGSIARGTFSVDGDAPDLGYRGRFRGVLAKLLDDCVVLKETPTEDQSLLARSAVEAVGEMQSLSSFIEVGEMINRQTTGLKDPPPVVYPEALRKDLDEYRATRPGMLSKAQVIIDDGRFGQLKLRY